MTAQYVQDDDYVDYTPGSDLAAGSVVVQGDLIGVNVRPIPANTLGALAVEGVFDVPKAAGASTGIASGTTVYWNAGAQQATTIATGNKLMGKTTRAAADADTTVRVRLFQ